MSEYVFKTEMKFILALVLSMVSSQLSKETYSFQYALSNGGEHATVVSYDDDSFYISFKGLNNSVCRLTKQSSNG